MTGHVRRWLAMPACVAALCVVAAAPLAGAQERGALRQALRDRASGRNEQATLLPLPPGTRVQRNLAYGRDAKQVFDVYLPPDPRNAPVLVMVHGGGWALGDKASPGVAENKVAHWLPKGWIVVSANNRLLPDADPLQQARDVAAATARVQRLAPQWGGDPARVVLMGHSAGAHLVALVGADPAFLRDAGARPVRGVVALDSAAMDAVAAAADPPLPRIYDQAFGKDPAAIRAASPLHRLQPGAAPLLSVCSTLRRQVCAQSRAFASAAAAVGTRVEVLPQPLSHKAINQALGLPSDYTRAVDVFVDGLVR